MGKWNVLERREMHRRDICWKYFAGKRPLWGLRRTRKYITKMDKDIGWKKVARLYLGQDKDQ
jgi:hypothetical protein